MTEGGPSDAFDRDAANERTQADMGTSSAMMAPDHPLLQRAQAALKSQLVDAKLRLEGELREKMKLLNDAKVKRESVGVELFGFQQQLAKLQMELERAHERHVQVAVVREEADARLQSLKVEHDGELKLTRDERVRADKFQEELDRQAATLRQIAAYNEEMKHEIAITRRATYKAEEAVQKLEKEKARQDSLIDSLQETLKSLHQQAALFGAQIVAQKRETRAAMETLMEAEKEMESIHFEKRQLVAQWQSSLQAIAHREEALVAIKRAMHEQQEQELSIISELGRFKKDVQSEQVKHETLTSVMQKLEGELENLKKSLENTKDRQNHLGETYAKLDQALTTMEGKLKRCDMEHKALEKEMTATDKAFMKAGQDNSVIEEKMMAVLGDQTTVEKGSGRTAADIQKTRKEVRDKELQVVSIQNEVSKLTVDVLNTEAHNVRLDDTLQLLDEELAEKSKVVEKYETEMRQRNDEIEKKTRTVDFLNRKFEKLVYNMEGEDTGPLEATISNLTREIQKKGVESKDLQRHWINLQTELVSKQISNGALTEAHARSTSDYSILFQKKVRLEQELDRETKQMKGIDRSMTGLNQDMIRLNTLISNNQKLSALLEDETFNLESEIMAELKDLEMAAVKLEGAIDSATQQKKDCVADILETERQVMLWDRKIQLEREMQDMLDPNVGQSAVQAMKKEIHRMKLRKEEMAQIKEQLMKELERAISKRETISSKGRAAVANSKKPGFKMTEKQLEKKVDELKRSIADTENECKLTDERVVKLDQQRVAMASEMQNSASECGDMQQQEARLHQDIEELLREKTGKLLRTARVQTAARALEEVVAGRYKPCVSNPDNVAAELQRAKDKQSVVAAVVQQLMQSKEDVAPYLERVLLHVQAVDVV